MTPFGEMVRELRAKRGVTLKQMAGDLDLSAAYLSALEHGRRGRPSGVLIRQVCSYFNIIWDDAEELERRANLSHPRVKIDTAGLSPKATELANRLASGIASLPDDKLARLLDELGS